MNKIITSIAAALLACTALSAQEWKPADPEATPEAVELFSRLVRIADKGIMYGHQDDLVTGSTWRAEYGRSDTKEAVGDYPAVAGFELGELELGYQHSLDSVFFKDIANRFKWFHEQNGIITVSWHLVNPISSQWPGIKEPNGAGSAWDVNMLSAEGINAVASVLPGGENNAMFNSWLDRLAKFFLSLKDDDGNLIPFIFRPYHEHSGSFFWWGRGRCYDEEYAALWRYTVTYLRGKGLHNILYAYNTDKVYSAEEFLRGYPGDEYIDMLSIDWYGQGEEFNRNIDAALKFTTELAESRCKLHALSECGPLSEDLQKILANYRSSYVLTWRNAPPRGKRPAGIAPPAGAPRRMDPNALIKTLKKNNRYLFLQDIQKIK